jgi:D-glycero-D-manno-heptose 1,7-bisphosphate phosphatase
MNKNKALFLDRDGVINFESGAQTDPNKLIIIDGIKEIITHYKQNGYLIIVVTNQGCIASGQATREQVDNVHTHMNKLLDNQIDKFYLCPHPFYNNFCNCHKPKPAMILEAIKEFNIDPKSSIIMGDLPTDILAGKNAGVKLGYLKKTNEIIKLRDFIGLIKPI